MLIEAPEEGISTCRPTGPKGELIEITFDSVSVRGSLRGEIKKIEVVQDFESRPRNTRTFRKCQVIVVVNCQVEARQEEGMKERRSISDVRKLLQLKARRRKEPIVTES